MNKLLVVIVCLLTLQNVVAQYYTTGDDPLNMHLRQIRTDKCRIIFDRPMQPWAVRIAQQLDSIAQAVSTSLGHTPQRIDIMLHSRDAYSNGLVSWAPNRMELYTYPQTDGDCIPWTTHLALHEYRHVVQTSTLNRGFTRFLNILFGQQATGAVLGIYVPLWFMEGDAVTNETAMSQGGRGRQASFIQQMRTLVICNQAPSYDQAYNGSYRQRIPDYYHMGYLTVSNVRRKYGTHVWQKALENVGKKSFSFVPFNHSLKESTGLYKTDLYAEAIHDWRLFWQQQDAQITPTPYTTLLQTTTDYCEYTSTQITNNGLVAYETTPDRIARIIGANKQTITIPTIRNENNIAARGNIIVWCEMHPHIRWNNAHSSRLMMCDANGRHKHTILRRGMYSTPSVSPNEQHIAVVSTNDSGLQSIIVIDPKQNNIIYTYQLQLFEQATATTWIDNNKIAYISLTDSGKCIIELNTTTNSVHKLTTPRFENIRHITSHNGIIYYTSDESGLNNIYQLCPNSTPQRITSARYGAAWPCVTDTTLIYSEYSTKGYAIVSTPLCTRPTDTPSSPMHLIADTLSAQESINKYNQNTNTDTTMHYYSRAAHLFRLHSWGPIVVDANNNTINAGIAIASQNTLGNSILSGGINWNNETSERYFATYTYTALYPKISLIGKWGYYDYNFDGALLDSDEQHGTRYTYNERQKVQHYKAQISQPITFASGAWNYGIQPAISLEYYYAKPITLTTQRFEVKRNAYVLTNEKTTSSIYKTNYTDLDYQLYTYLVRRISSRDVGYRYGLTFEIGQSNSIGTDKFGSRQYVLTNIYLPGIGQHHNIHIQAQIQKKKVGDTATTITGTTYKLLMNDIIGNPRGLTSIRNTQSQLLRINYTLPIANPDLSLGPVCYIKRINLRTFYDTQHIRTCPLYNEDNKQWTTRSSIGGELWAETYWLRLPYNFKIGYRGSQVINGHYKSELLFSVTIK